MKKIWLPIALAAFLLGVWFLHGRVPEPATTAKIPDPEIPKPASGTAAPPADSGFRIPRLPLLEGKPVPITVDRVPAVLSRLSSEFRSRADILWHDPPPRFERESATRLREARLLALAFPDQCLPLIRNLAVSTDNADRDLGVRLLHFMAEAGHPAALSALADLARNPDSTVASLALLELKPADIRATQRPVFFEKAAEGSLEAIPALGAYGDSETAALLNTLLRNPREDALWQQARLAASKSLEQCTLLRSDRAEAELKQILSGTDPRTVGSTEWALLAAQVRGWPGLRECLAERLSKRAEPVLRRGARGEASFVEDAAPQGLDDYYFDDLLVTYAGLGGPLTELQQRRLATFGYTGDPAQRLAELLGSEK